MADDITLDAGAGGPTVRALSDGTDSWPVGVTAYPTGGSAGAWSLQIVDLTHGLPVAVQDLGAGDYETVAASQTDQALGATGATGDYLSGLLIVPATTAAGAVSIKDGSGSAISVFAGGGTTALTTLIPFFVPLGIKSAAGAWKVTTGANVSVIASGNFT